MDRMNSNFVIYAVMFAACALLWGFFGASSALLCFGVFHFLVWVNVTVTALCNSLVGKPVNGGDALYRLLCIIISSVCFAMALA